MTLTLRDRLCMLPCNKTSLFPPSPPPPKACHPPLTVAAGPHLEDHPSNTAP